MDPTNRERWAAASGFASLVTGAAGGAMERGWPSAADPAKVGAFVADHRAAILAQSMFFVLSSGIYLWFFGSLRAFLARAEGGTGRLSSVVFGAGSVWVSLQMMAQAFQVGAAMTGAESLEPAFLWTMAAAFSISNLPLAVMLVATAAATFETRVFPQWLGWMALDPCKAHGRRSERR